MSCLTDNIKKHPIISFIFLTFVISYAIFALIPVLSIKNPSYQLLISIIGAYGIALSAMIVSRILNPASTKINPLKQCIIFLILFIIILPLALYNPYLKLNLSDMVVIIFCSIISALSAYILSGVLSKNTGIRNLMIPVTKWKVNPIFYLIALLTWPIINILSNIISLIYQGQPISNINILIFSNDPLTVIIFFFSTLLVTTSVAEETGWRGFLLPHLQSKYSPLIASVIVCFVWEPWHIGLYFTGLYPLDYMAIIFDRIIPIALGGVILYTWLYNRTKNNLLMVMLFHASANVSAGIFPTNNGIAMPIFILITFILSIIVIFTDKMWKSLHNSLKNLELKKILLILGHVQ